MKTFSKTPVPTLIAFLGLSVANPALAQTFTVLHSFTAYDGSTGKNNDGSIPTSLILESNVLYGTTYFGGSLGGGVLFKLNADGTGFKILHSFRNLTLGADSYGSHPNGLAVSDDTLYGTADWGGLVNQGGVVFKVNTDGSGFANLHNFGGINDGTPPFGPVLSGDTLYGTTWGISSLLGTVFAIHTNGTGYMILHSFERDADGFGARPSGGLVLASNILFGVSSGSSSNGGTVFGLNIDGTGFKNLYSFTIPVPNENGFGTNSDGTLPDGLVLSGSTLYGITQMGGSGAAGIVFKLSTDGTGFTTLHSFAPILDPFGTGNGTNMDGIFPIALVLSGNTLYGTTAGGPPGSGTVFKLNIDGSGFQMLYNFTRTFGPSYTNSDGALPLEVICSGMSLYGRADQGGISGYGTIFSISLAPSSPRLAINSIGANVVLTWPISASGFFLQSAPSITGTYTNIRGATTPYTNSLTGTQQYFRLIAN